ncbi:MAG: PA1571 family protein [Pseudomonas sp.]
MHKGMHNKSNCFAVIPPNAQAEKTQQWVSGAIIDDQGREIPITKQMIQHACGELEKAWCSSSSQAE